MFERYTEKARRVIFFARYEASQYGSPYIESEHLLLGLLREGKQFATRFFNSSEGLEAIRAQIDKLTVHQPKTPTSVDLPLSNECKRILAYAAEESERLAHKSIAPEHLLLGIVREGKCLAAGLLRQHGFDSQKFREDLLTPGVQEHSRDTAERYYSRALGRSAAAMEDITIHGQPRNADFIRRAVKKLREISWHWQKREWTPRDIVIHRKTHALSFETALAEDKKHFDLVKEGWNKDYCKICHWDLFASKDEPEHATGYTNGRDWLCTECYEKFFSRDDFFSSNYPELT
jgi:ClpA/ClpB-like protein